MQCGTFCMVQETTARLKAESYCVDSSEAWQIMLTHLAAFEPVQVWQKMLVEKPFAA